MFEQIACAALTMVLFYREWFHGRREDRMLDRLMSKSVTEYKQTIGEYKPPEGRKRVAMSDAAMAKREDLYSTIKER